MRPIAQSVPLLLVSLLVSITGGLAACSKPARVGEHVWVSWEDGRYRAFVVERIGASHLRVQFEGCDSSWQRDITGDRILERVDEVEATRPATDPVCAQRGPTAHGTDAGVGAPYRAGERLRVRWRGSVYTANVVSVVAPDRFLVHYEGYENAWDEIVPLERIEGTR